MADVVDGIPLPVYAYVPGQNARHPEDAFDDIKRSARAGMAPSELQHTAAFRAGLVYLDAGYFWECHEVLEAVWMQTQPGTPEREMVQALIQLANARLKIRMQRPRAAERLCAMVEQHLVRCPAGASILGLMPEEVRDWLGEVVKALNDR